MISFDSKIITNAAGQVALRYYQPAPVRIQNLPGGREYIAEVKAAISIAWIEPDDVTAVLAKRGGCCNRKRQLFDYASPDAVHIWTNGGGR